MRALSQDVRQYLLITGNYWAFTLTDGALRMLVVLHFHQLGYSPLQVAMLFVFYEVFGVITNLVGGWLGARIGLNRTMNIGLGLQVAALAMLLVARALARRGARTEATLLVAVVAAQMTLGILTVVTGVSMWIAVLHQVTGAILVATTAASLHQLGRPAA